MSSLQNKHKDKILRIKFILKNYGERNLIVKMMINMNILTINDQLSTANYKIIKINQCSLIILIFLEFYLLTFGNIVFYIFKGLLIFVFFKSYLLLGIFFDLLMFIIIFGFSPSLLTNCLPVSS